MPSRTGGKGKGGGRPRKSSKAESIPTDKYLIASGFAHRKFQREDKICGTAEQVLVALCRYRRLPYYEWTVRPAKQNAVDGRRIRDKSYLAIYLASPMRWHSDVYKNGLAAASGCFVFEVVKERTDGSLIIVAGKQGRGYSVNLAYAVARPHAGAWRLEWKGLPREFKSPPPNPKGAADSEFYDFMIAKKILDETAWMYETEPPARDEDDHPPHAS